MAAHKIVTPPFNWPFRTCSFLVITSLLSRNPISSLCCGSCLWL